MKVQIMKLSLLWGLIALCGGLLGCEDRVDDVTPPVDEDELVPVSLSFGFADEMGSYTPVPGSRSGLASKEALPPSRRAQRPTSTHEAPTLLYRTTCTILKSCNMIRTAII